MLIYSDSYRTTDKKDLFDNNKSAYYLTLINYRLDRLKELSEKTISCKDVTFRIFGLSLTSINIVISLLFIITLLKIFKKYEKNK